jgi:hypothetical protein
VKRSKTTLGSAFGTFVVLNACEVAREGSVLTWTGGFADAFLARSFGGMLAPMWSVADADARWMIEEFYKRAYGERRPVGEVIRELRGLKAAKSPTVLSYVYYGDVMAAFRSVGGVGAGARRLRSGGGPGAPRAVSRAPGAHGL